MKIINIDALQILDSRGNPTIEVKVEVEGSHIGQFRVPSGASTGIHEACELRDQNKKIYGGKSVLKAVKNVLNIRKELIGKDFDQNSLDRKLIEIDGTENKSKIGANAILGISVAFSKASAKYYNLELYDYLHRLAFGISFYNRKKLNPSQVHLFANVINGGLHSGNGLNIQEFMIIPTFGKVQDKIRAISEIYQVLKILIEKKYGKANTAVGDEGGFAPNIDKPTEALDLLIVAIKQAGYFGKVSLALDCAASDFYDSKTKLYEVEKGLKLDYKKLTIYYNNLVKKYPIISIEDPMSEDDFEGFSYFMKNSILLSKKNVFNGKKQILCVGDDLLVTNSKRIKIASEKELCNSLLLKINQIGTLSESIEAYKLASKNNWHTIVSHRSGETSDDFIADLCVALESSIKIGAPARGERVSKYNRLLNIFN